MAVEVGAFGEGTLAPCQDRLAALGAEIVNRWLSKAEIAEAFAARDAVALSLTGASQSGVAAAALGAGLPIIATPVGGLTGQIVDGRTGVLARGVTAAYFAGAVERLARDPVLYDGIAAALTATAAERSVKHFAEALVQAVLGR